jgi:hypothetical protein
VEDKTRPAGGCVVWGEMMKILNAKSMTEIGPSKLDSLLADEYVKLWVAKYGSPPKGMHPIPSDVAEEEVQFFIDF